MNRITGLLCAGIAAAALVAGAAVAAGPDVVVSDSTTLSSYGPVGALRAYSIGSSTCNIGNQNLAWTNNNTPGFAMNAYRLHDGRLMQIGMSWVKTACCAFADPSCGMSCNGAAGSQLGAGCQDVYTSGWNAGQGRLARRSGINAFTGAFANADGATGDAIFKRLQVLQSDMDPANFPGALFFFEGVYAASDDATWQNWLNNASYKRVTFNASYAPTYQGSIFQFKAGIHAWKDHGLGPNTPDPAVTITNVDIPAEGRLILGHKVTNLGGGLWRYDYALYNLNSDKSVGEVTVAGPAGVTYTNIGFNDVNYHSGEIYDNTNWGSASGPGGVTWQSPQTHAQNPNSNALRWGTMYNYWFTANTPPRNGSVAIGLFKPHTPQSVSATTLVPSCFLDGDMNGDGSVNGADVQDYVNCALAPGLLTAGCFCADMDENDVVNDLDTTAFVAALLNG
ncbi:hypothetical protein RAS2_12590 [Phycisphaerae bacterium RAS2]|nr:hypothetical protein RAS2_12590 [Phycisphaerae bacterium RAS2]